MNTVTIHQCHHIGVAGTTPVVVQLNNDGLYEARIGIAIMGAMNMNEADFKACDYNPFHKDFQDNFASGKGATEAEALDAMKADMQSISNTLWD